MKIEIKHKFFGNVLFTCESESSLKDAVEQAVRENVSLAGADLREAKLGGAKLGGADLGEADLAGADLREADLAGADLRGAKLGGADLGGADLREAKLREADLRVTSLRGAKLGGADLGEADLRLTDLREAKFGLTDLIGANLKGADLRGTGLIQIAGIGSVSGCTTFDIKTGNVVCGCFCGTFEEFENRVKQTHNESSKYRKQYLSAIEFIKSIQ